MTGRRGGRDAGRTAVREAQADDALDVRRVLDGALLDVPEDLEARIRAGEALVAEDERVTEGSAGDGAGEQDGDDGSIVGALVLDGSHVAAVAVRRRRRGSGIGSELVEAAAERVDGPLTADFREEIRPFYESLGFDVEGDPTRLRGTYDG